jgi:hypothetical protein
MDGTFQSFELEHWFDGNTYEAKFASGLDWSLTAIERWDSGIISIELIDTIIIS